MKAHPLGFVEHREAFGPQGKYGKWLRSLPAINKVGNSIFLHGGINPSLQFKNIDQLNTSIKNEVQAFDRITQYLIGKELALPFYTLVEFVQAAKEEFDKDQRHKSRRPDPGNSRTRPGSRKPVRDHKLDDGE
jgi:hypothetical protein